MQDKILGLNDLEKHNRKGVDPFVECKNLLETTHIIDDMFHSKEMDELFPGHAESLEERPEIHQGVYNDNCAEKEIIVMEGDND